MDVGRILSGWAAIIGILVLIVVFLLASGIVSIQIERNDDDDYIKHYDDEDEEEGE